MWWIRLDIRVYPSRCLHKWFKGSECSLCVDECPASAIRLDTGKGGARLVIEPDKCIYCGRCVSVCPMMVFESSMGLDRVQTGSIGQGSVMVSCRVKGGSVVNSCINYLRMEHYIVLLDHIDKIIIDARCEGCPYKSDRVVGDIDKIASILPGRVKVLKGRYPSPQARRRALEKMIRIAGMIATGVDVSGNRMIIVESNRPERPPIELRKRAYRILSRIKVESPWRHPIIDIDKCTFTGICAGVCPTNAIEYNEHGIIKIHVDSCISCGLCMNLCPENAISMNGQSLDPITYEKSIKVCGKCGFIYPSDLGECPKCKSVEEMIKDFYEGRDRSCTQYNKYLGWRG